MARAGEKYWRAILFDFFRAISADQMTKLIGNFFSDFQFFSKFSDFPAVISSQDTRVIGCFAGERDDSRRDATLTASRRSTRARTQRGIPLRMSGAFTSRKV